MAQNPEERHAFMQRLIEQRGLRGQLATASFVTGQRYVSLRYVPKSPKARIDWSVPNPELPTVPSTLPELEAKLGRIVEKLERLPLDAIGADLRKTLAGIDQTLQDARGVLDRFDADVLPALQATLEETRRAVGAAERMLTSTEANLVGPTAPGQLELRNTMQEIARAARSLRILADFLERHPEALIRGKTSQPSTP
jgi:paraquat-inducible protein B